MSKNLEITQEERRGRNVATVTMNLLPPNNTINLDMMVSFTETMQNLCKENDAIIVKSANEKFFSNGLDGKFLLDSNNDIRKESILEMTRFYGNLWMLPKPWFVKIEGFAMAGGAVLSGAADYRYMLEGNGRIGFTEPLVGLYIPRAYMAGIRSFVNPSALRPILEGKAYKALEAKEINLIDETAETSEALQKLIYRKIDSMFRLPGDTFFATRMAYRELVYRDIQAGTEEDLKLIPPFLEMPDFEEALKRIAGKN